MAGWNAARQAERLLVGIVGIGLVCSFSAAAHANSTQSRILFDTKQVMQSLEFYAGDHQGRLPGTLEELVPEYLPNKDLFAGIILVCPPQAVLKSLPARTTILVTNRLSSRGDLRVAYADGSVEFVQPSVRPTAPSRTDPDKLLLIVLAIGGWLLAFVLWINSRGKTVVSQPETWSARPVASELRRQSLP